MRKRATSRLAAGVLAATVCFGCAARQTYPPPTRADFIRESLLGVGTPTTPDFWERPGCYYADKLDLLDGLREYRERLGETIQGLVVVGPSGPLWQYAVLTFLKRGESQQLNWLVFPHARITSKGVLQLEPAEYTQLLEAVLTCLGMHSGIPTDDLLPRDPTKELDLDWRYDILVADWSTGHERVWFSRPEAPHEELKSLYDVFDDMFKRSTRTYGNYGGLELEEILHEP